eukprot:853896-Rhodomonas_salina.2
MSAPVPPCPPPAAAESDPRCHVPRECSASVTPDGDYRHHGVAEQIMRIAINLLIAMQLLVLSVILPPGCQRGRTAAPRAVGDAGGAGED